MGAVRSFLSPFTTVALLLGSTALGLAQGSAGDAGNWLTQPAPGVPSTSASPSGGQGSSGSAGGQSAPGIGGWNVRQGDGGTMIYTPNGSSGGNTGSSGGATPSGGTSGSGSTGGQSVPGIGGWNVRPGDGGTMIYTPNGSSGDNTGSSGGATPSGTGTSGTTSGSSGADGSGSSGSSGGSGAGSPFDGQSHPVPGKPGWSVRWDANSGQFVYAPPTSQQPQQPQQPVTHEEEGGWVEDKNGKTKVIYIKDEKGNVVGGYYAHYDAQGNFKGKEPFNGLGTPTTSDLPTQADLQGTYSGSFSGGATGHITLYVSGSIVSGTISGDKSGDPVHAQFSGSIDGSGRFGANISGTVEWGKGIAFGGNMQGSISKSGGSGTWTGAGGLDKASGTWRVSR